MKIEIQCTKTSEMQQKQCKREVSGKMPAPRNKKNLK